MPDERVRLSSHHRQCLWGTVAAICLLGGGLLWGQTLWFVHKHDAWRAACRQIDASTALLAPQSESRLKALWEKYNRKLLTPEKLQEELGGGTISTAPTASKGRRTLIWRDPRGGHCAEIFFDNGKLDGMGYGTNPGAFYPKEPKPSVFYQATETARKWLAGSPRHWGALIWACPGLLLACVFSGQYRSLMPSLRV